MPRNSSGTYTLPAGNPVIPNTLIETTWANPTLSDVASSLTDSLDRFGRGGMLAPLRFPDGTVTAPSIAFSSETTLGVFRPSVGVLALAVGGVSRFLLTASLLTITPPTTFQGAVTFSGGATLTGPIIVDKLYSNASEQAFGGTPITPDWQMAGTGAAASFFGQSRFSNGTAGPAVYLGHSRGATVGTQTVVASGDQFAQISFFGSDGTSFREGARIVAESDGSPGTADMPGRLRFLTTPDGTATPIEALRISNDKGALFAGTVNVTDTFTALANAAVTTSLTVGSTLTVGTTLNVSGATTLQTTAVIGSNIAIPANTRAYIDRLGTSVLPTLGAATVLTLAGSGAASNNATLQLVSGNTGSTTIQFGDTDAASRGAVAYSHSADALTFSTAGATAVTINSSGDLLLTNAFGLSNGTAAAPSLYWTSSPTTGLYRVTTDVIGIATAGVERWRINATGITASGGAITTSRVSATSVQPQLQVNGTTLSTSSLGAFAFETTSASTTPYLNLGRSRSAAPGGFAIVSSGDAIGRISAAGADGTQFTEGARIQFSVDGTPGLNDMPGRIDLMTTADGASSPTNVLSLRADGTASFTGTVNGVDMTLTGTSAAPLTLSRTGSTINVAIGYTTTSGTVYAGQGPANAFAVGASSGLNAANWFNISASAAAFSVNTSITGTITSTSTARFNGATQGLLGVMESTGSGATANTNADSLVIDSSVNAGISLLAPNTATCNIYFGDPESSLSGRIVYTHSTDAITLFAGGALALTLSSTLMTMAAGVDLILDNAGPTSTLTAGWRGVPQNSRSAAYTLVLADAGKHIYHPSADTTARTFTIPANASVAFPIGTAVTFINDSSAGTITIAITTDTLVLMGAGSTGSRTLAANGVATAVKVTATRWVISGTNLT